MTALNHPLAWTHPQPIRRSPRRARIARLVRIIAKFIGVSK